MNDPNWRLPVVPSFAFESPDFASGDELPVWARSKYWGSLGQDKSPSLEWSGLPALAGSLVLTVYDPDAPTGSGWWHWVVINIPSTVTSLPAGAGADPGLLPPGARTAFNESRETSYFGAAPPAGTGSHRYVFTLSALDVARLEIDEEATPAMIGAVMRDHVLARAQIVAFASADPNG